jgi:protocatechuate 4,5-dioxygenase, beta chain
MARIVAGIGLSHVPSVGMVYDRGRQQEPAWKPLFDAYVPVREWLARLKPDIAIVVYNDHGADFLFDKYPTFAIGAADRYGIADEGFGTRALPELPGDAEFSWHLCEALVYDEFDLTICQEMAVEHGFLVPMNLCFPHGEQGWPVATVPLQVNVLQHPLPTARRCLRLGQAIRRAVEACDRDLRVVVMGTGGMSHQLQGKRFGYMSEEFDQEFLDRIERDPEGLAQMTHHELMERAGAEAVELIMWLVMRGAMSEQITKVHSHYFVPASNTAAGIALFDNRVPQPA